MADRENCLLNSGARNCCNMTCSVCGWDKAVNQARNQEIEANGLTLCSDGKRRLIIKNTKEEEV
jgi:hypothetical protein